MERTASTHSHRRVFLLSGIVLMVVLAFFFVPVSADGSLYDPNDPIYPNQWWLNQESSGGGINAPEAWGLSTGDDSIVVAVIDSGVDIDHPDLKDHIWTNLLEYYGEPGVDDDHNGFIDDVHGWNALYNISDVNDYYGHGTHCAGIIGAVTNNNEGIAGTAWNVTIMPVVVLNAGGVGSDRVISAGINYAVNNGADIISISISEPVGETPSDMEKVAIEAAKQRGIPCVIAAGNNGNDNDVDGKHVYPASFDCSNIIAVAASDSNNMLPSFSNYGPTLVDIAAPGVDINSTMPVVAGEGPMFGMEYENIPTPFYGLNTTGSPWVLNETSGIGNISGAVASLLYYNQSIPIPADDTQFGVTVYSGGDISGDNYAGFVISNKSFASYQDISDILADTTHCRYLSLIKNISLPYGSYKPIHVSHGWKDIQTILAPDQNSYYIGFVYNSADPENKLYLYQMGFQYQFSISSHTYKDDSGTSMATPMVAGAVAVIKSINPSLTPEEIREIIIDTADKNVGDLAGKTVSDGRLNLSAAALNAQEFMVTFNSTGGSDVRSQVVRYNKTVEKPDDPVRAGYAFADWYSDPELTEKWDFAADKVLEPTTLYANWTVNQTKSIVPSSGIATFGNDNTTALRSEVEDTISTMVLQDVSNLSAGSSVTFTADNTTTLPLPGIDGRSAVEVAVFEINATINASSPVAEFTITVTFTDDTTAVEYADDMRFWHYNETVQEWDEKPLEWHKSRSGSEVTYTVYTHSFSRFGGGLYPVIPPEPTPSYSGSSRNSGYTVILPETAVPTVTPTVTPTPVPTLATPTVAPVTQSTTRPTQKSPAPLAGLLIGLGMAALLYRLRK